MSALLDNCPLISDLEPWRNSKGYADPTAYKALRAVEISEFGHRPLTYICSLYSEDVEVKLLWLAICNIEDKRARQRAKQATKPRKERTQAPGRLIEGQAVSNWPKVLQELSLHYPERFETN